MSEIPILRPGFEPFDVHPRRGVSGIVPVLLCLVLDLFFCCLSVVWVVGIVKNWPVASESWFVLAILLVLDLVLLKIVLRQFVHFHVDTDGIHKLGPDPPNWHLPWSDVAVRQLGPLRTVFAHLAFIPLHAGPYQTIEIHDRFGRKRRINRFWVNGDRLDQLLGLFLDPQRPAKIADRVEQAMQQAARIHRQEQQHRANLPPVLADAGGANPIQVVTRRSRVLRLRASESILPPVCCNCLGPAAHWVHLVQSDTSLSGLFLFFMAHHHRFVQLAIPLCGFCFRRTLASGGGTVLRAFFGCLLVVFAVLGFTLTTIPAKPAERFVAGGFGVACTLGVIGLIWWQVRRLTPAKLVSIRRYHGGDGWMDVRFGNPKYADLVEEVNELERPGAESLPSS